jgi:hypothetical protein
LSKAFGITFAVVALIIAGIVWYGFEDTKGNHLAPTGSIGKVRTVKAADDLTYMVVDFKVKNDSDRDMVVRTIEATVETKDGQSIMGSTVAKSDVDAAFQSYPLLGEQYNPVLRERDSIPPHQELDRMVGIRLDAPAEKIEARKLVTLRLLDVTGAEVTLTK